MNEQLSAAVGRALGLPIRSCRALAGGDINDAWSAQLADGRQVFIKSNQRAHPRMFPSEAQGLAWLAGPGVIRVPAVLAVNDPDRQEPGFLVLELIRPAARTHGYDEDLGRSLAALHRAGASSFGLDYDNFIGTLPQHNQPCAGWIDFYARRRLMPQVLLAIERGRAPHEWKASFERLAAILDQITGPPEPPARLHGDLWSGNLHTDERGRPCLIDPAVYGGHREVDLAMLELFGSPSERFFAAYDEVYPLAPERDRRVALYQLYPLLVHVNLFGGGYVASVERALHCYI